MGLSKAVVFTHISVSSEQANQTKAESGARALIERVVPFFKKLLLCKNIGLVYVYIDVGTELVLERLSDSEIRFSMKTLESEERTRNCLKIAADEAIQDLVDEAEPSFDRAQAPRFQFIGLPHLMSLFNALFRIDPGLISNLAGELHNFTYDSPKFVEAVIRLVRGGHPIHDQYPILRFDADVEVNEHGIAELIKSVNHDLNTGSIFSFFSGGYGRLDGIAEPVNDYAVRVHWLVDQQLSKEPLKLKERGKDFLRDLGEIGPSQLPAANSMSKAMHDFVSSKRKGQTTNRTSPQVISGAGLYMSLLAIRLLPPFMNSNNLTLWIDDHLKRRLHEALGHLTTGSLERVKEARFHQERFANGTIAPDDLNWASQVYFERVFRGCLLHAMIENPDGTAGPVSLAIGEIIDQPTVAVDLDKLRDELLNLANETAKDVLGIWKDADYGDLMLSDWAKESEAEVGKFATTTVDDALSYVKLVARWPLYVSAIERLKPVQAYWLFRRVEGATFQ
jgi:hypothetical protein